MAQWSLATAFTDGQNKVRERNQARGTIVGIEMKKADYPVLNLIIIYKETTSVKIHNQVFFFPTSILKLFISNKHTTKLAHTTD